MKYRKIRWMRRQDPVDAVIWRKHGDHDAVEPYGKAEGTCATCDKTFKDHGWIKKWLLIVCPSDWVITDNGGGHKVISSDEFPEHYTQSQVAEIAELATHDNEAIIRMVRDRLSMDIELLLRTNVSTLRLTFGEIAEVLIHIPRHGISAGPSELTLNEQHTSEDLSDEQKAAITKAAGLSLP